MILIFYGGGKIEFFFYFCLKSDMIKFVIYSKKCIKKVLYDVLIVNNIFLGKKKIR